MYNNSNKFGWNLRNTNITYVHKVNLKVLKLSEQLETADKALGQFVR